MLSWKVKGVLALLGVATLMQAAPRDADAFIFRWLRARRAARVAYYPGVRVANFVPTPQPHCGTCAPVCPAPCPAPCPPPAPCAQQVCSMVPQVSYRTVYRQVPVTTYRPVTTCDPCTGCPRTVMQPCTTVTYQAQRVPVTTYQQVCRMVPTAPACPTCPSAGCPTCPSAVPYAAASPMLPGAGVASAAPGCSSCGVPQATYAPPAQAYPGPATSLSPVPSPNYAPMTVPGPSGSGGAAESPPTLAPGQGQGQGQSQYPTIQGSSARGTTNTYRQPNALPDLRPLPDLERSNESSAPPLLNPDDRTARIDTVREGAIVPISWEVTAPAQPKVVAAAVPAQPAPPAARPAVKRLDDSGWRAAL